MCPEYIEGFRSVGDLDENLEYTDTFFTRNKHLKKVVGMDTFMQLRNDRMKPDFFAPVKVPPTCKLRWDHVDPKEKQWFCSHCQHDVHNVSAMTRREAKKFMSTPCEGRCISFLQDDQGRAVFRRPLLSFDSATRKLSWFLSSLFVLLVSGCATCPPKEATQKTTTVAAAKDQNDQAATQKSEKRLRRWTGY
jgi:hypothetical protein